MAAITICSDLGAHNNKASHCFHCFHIYLPWSDGSRCHDLSFWMLSFKSTFSWMIFLLYSVNISTCALHLSYPLFLLGLVLSTFPLLFCIFNLSCSLFLVLIIHTSSNLKLDSDSISPLKLIKKNYQFSRAAEENKISNISHSIYRIETSWLFREEELFL